MRSMLQSPRTSIPGYKDAVILQSDSHAAVYRAVRETDDQSVLLKIAGGDAHAGARLRREFDICRSLNLEGITQPLSLETMETGPAMVLAPFEGTSLAELIKRGEISPTRCLVLTAALARLLGEIHERGIVHKDIKPAAIMVRGDEILLGGFAIASRLNREEQSARTLEGTPTYISPEQTGRMNRSLDYRSDFYSLGVTMYEMLTGAPPFVSHDPLELVHAHIARLPRPPHEKDSGIPAAISGIVMKLLAKTAEHRYQSVFGLTADLDFCIRELRENHAVPDFTPALQDRSEVFRVPEKLYGREQEIRRLLEIFGAARDGANKLLLVAGYSGIGKSSLVNEVQRPITEARGYFISGKFDQFKRDIPYSAVIQAFQDLVRQLLTEENIDAWREDLLLALGNTAGVIVDVIPEVELIIGPQPAPPDLSPAESENRFNLVFRKFVRVLADSDHPLVIFLDDLQWADAASLKLIYQLSTDPETGHLLLLGAYRDNETGHGHPLLETLDRARETIGAIEQISPAVLSRENIRAMAADALGASPEDTASLAELVLEKTGGNPFFTREFLKELYRNGSLAFHRGDGRWRWNTDRIRSMEITDNVVDLMAGKILELPDASREALKIAACVGNRFDLDLLAPVLKKTAAETARALEDALKLELVIPLGDDYKYIDDEVEIADGDEPSAHKRIAYRFVHDRVQQAAYQAIPESERRDVHLMIGRLIPRSGGDPRREDRLIDIVNHLNLGSDLITDADERLETARLNLAAGRNARSSAAYGSALTYFRAASALLPEDAWNAHYELTLRVRLELLEAYYLNGEYDRADAFADELLGILTEPLDRMGVYLLSVPAQNSAGRPQQSIDLVRKALRELGIRLPANPGQLTVLKDVVLTRIMLSRHSMESLEAIPELEDPILTAAHGLLSEAATAAFFLDSNFFPIMILYMVRLSIRRGHSRYSSIAFVIYGLILSGILMKFKEGYDFGELAMRIQARLGARNLAARVTYLHGYFLRHWEHPLSKITGHLEDGTSMGWETGNLEYLSYALTCRNFIRFLLSENLDLVHEIALKDLAVLRNTKQDQSELFYIPFIQLLETLGGGDVENRTYSHDEAYPRLIAEKNNLCVCYSSLMTGIERALMNDYDGALRAFRQGSEFYDTIRGNPWTTFYHFFFGLSLIRANTANRRAKKRNLRQAAQHMRKLAKFAAHKPANREHRALLLRAELAAARNRESEARDYHARSLEIARREQLAGDQALSHELLGDFLSGRGENDQAREHFLRAGEQYAAWGARAKARQLANMRDLPPPPEKARRSPPSPPESETLREELAAMIQSMDVTADLDYVMEEGVEPSEPVREALTHLFRNALTHGLQNSAERRETDKTERGTIQVRGRRDGRFLVYSCEDDGHGLDPEQIRAIARERGLPEAKGEASTAALFKLIFHPEFSAISGKQFGMGLRHTRDIARRLNGRVILKSRKGEYTRVQLRVPLD